LASFSKIIASNGILFFRSEYIILYTLFEGKKPGGIFMQTRIRQATWNDRPTILELSAKIWEGEDYIPFTLDHWLHSGDPLLVLEDTASKRVLGVDHSLFLGETAWLEALRIDPAVEGRGLGFRIFQEMMRRTLERKPREIETMIWSENPASLRLTQKFGFVPLARYHLLEKPTVASGHTFFPWVRALFPAELPRLLGDFSPFLEASGHRFCEGWVVFPSVDQLGNTVLLEHPHGKILAKKNLHEPQVLSILLSTPPGSWLGEAVEQLQSWAGAHGFSRLLLSLPFPLQHWLEDFRSQGFFSLDYDCSDPGHNPFATHFRYLPQRFDDGIVAGQLGLKSGTAGNLYRVVTRCGYGFPRVVESFPLKKGKPFPTLFYLTCPHLHREVSRLEEVGLISAWEKDLDRDEQARNHAFYARLRQERLDFHHGAGNGEFHPAFQKGIGGISDPGHLKCLHLHVATHIAGIEESIGKRILCTLQQKGVSLDCPTMECFPFLEKQWKSPSVSGER